jgi:pyridoxal phosphate phosphatase PHOSPHO2
LPRNSQSEFYFFEGIPSEWGGPCQYGGRNLCKGSILKRYISGKNYKKVSFIGDGANDLCPALTLTANDQVYPRSGYALDKALTNAGDHYQVQAKITPWITGAEILKTLLSNATIHSK